MHAMQTVIPGNNSRWLLSKQGVRLNPGEEKTCKICLFCQEIKVTCVHVTHQGRKMHGLTVWGGFVE